jgi:histidinol-phosphate aminotransferase
VFQALLARGVIVRPMAGYRMPAWLRVSIGLPGENKRCIRELEKVLNQIPEA